MDGFVVVVVVVGLQRWKGGKISRGGTEEEEVETVGPIGISVDSRQEPVGSPVMGFGSPGMHEERHD